MSTFYKSLLEHFSPTLTVFQILNIWFPEIVWHWKYRSRLRCTSFATTLFDGRYLTSYLMLIAMFALYLIICKIFAKIIKCQKYWPWKWSRSRRTGLAPYDRKCWSPYTWIFQNFSYLATYVYAKINTHTYTYAVRDRGDDYAKFSKQIFVIKCIRPIMWQNIGLDKYSYSIWICQISEKIILIHPDVTPLDALSRYTGTTHSTDDAC